MAQPPRKDQLKRETQARSKKGKRKAREGEEKKRKESERKKKRTQKKRKIGKGGGGEQKKVILFHFGFDFFGVFFVMFWEKKNKRGRIKQRKRKGQTKLQRKGAETKQKKINFLRHYTDRCSSTFRNIE